MSETKTPPDKTPTDTEVGAKRPVLGLSLTQVVGGSAAAATAALLGSRLGTTGTIVGAALASIVSAIAGALYTASLARTRQVVAATKERLPSTVTLRIRSDLDQAAAGIESTADLDDKVDSAVEEAVDEAVDEAEASVPPLWSRVTWKYVALAAAAVFVIGALVITGVEVLTGQSLDGSSRTTFDHLTHDGRLPRSDITTTPTPTTPAQETPTAGASSPSSESSGSPTSRPSATSSPSASTSPSASPLRPGPPARARRRP